MLATVIPIESRRPQAKSESDDDLMVLVCGGSRDALKTLAERYLARLTSFCCKCVGDRAIAEEIVQETFLRVWSHRATYRSEGKFIVWLFTAARNLCRNHARSVSRERRWFGARIDEESFGKLPSNDDHGETLISREQIEGVRMALGGLSFVMREAILLRFEEGLSYDQIAAITNTPESTVRSRVHHGIKELRTLVEKRGGTP